MITLDMSATIETIDPNVIIQWLRHMFGIHWKALDWIRSYLHDHHSSVWWCFSQSEMTSNNISEPQGYIGCWSKSEYPSNWLYWSTASASPDYRTWRHFSLITNQLEISDPPWSYHWKLINPGSKPHKGHSVTQPSWYGTLFHWQSENLEHQNIKKINEDSSLNNRLQKYLWLYPTPMIGSSTSGLLQVLRTYLQM